MPPNHGGRRPGAGRKPGPPTRAIRLPVALIERLGPLLAKPGSELTRAQLAAESLSSHSAPLYTSKVAAGFPSPADDYVDRGLDLNEHLIRHKEATFFVRVKGDSMVGAGIMDGDLLVVDRALSPVSGRIVIAAVNGELTVKRLKKSGGRTWLMAENPAYEPIEMKDGMECVIWGVVTNAIHAF